MFVSSLFFLFVTFWASSLQSLEASSSRGEMKSIVKVYIDSSVAVSEVDPRFLSVALDSHLVAERWKNFDFKSKRVLHMAQALAPAFLRFLKEFFFKSCAFAFKYKKRNESLTS